MSHPGRTASQPQYLVFLVVSHVRMPDTERRKSVTSLRHGRHESRTTGHVTSEEKSNSEEDRRKEEIAQKKELYDEHFLKIWTDGRTDGQYNCLDVSRMCISSCHCCSMRLAEYWNRTAVTAASFNGNVCSNKAPNYAALRILLYTPRNKTGHPQFPLVCTQQIPTVDYVIAVSFLISWYLLCESPNHSTVPILSLMNPDHVVTLHSLQSNFRLFQSKCLFITNSLFGILDAKCVKVYHFFQTCYRNHLSYFPSFYPAVNAA